MLQTMGLQRARHDLVTEQQTVPKIMGFPGGSVVKNVSSNQEMQVQSLGQEDPPEKGMATHTPVFLPGEFHGKGSLAGYSP